MNIIQTPVRISTTGGVERYVHDLSVELISNGHHVTVVCAASSQVSKTDTTYSLITLSPLFRIANTEITPFLLNTLLSNRYDLIHTHIPTPWTADLSMLATWLKRKPLIVTYHNDITAGGWHSYIAAIYNRIFLPLVLKKAIWIIITRNNYRSPLLQKFSHKLIHIPPGVNAEQFKPEKLPKIGDLFFLSVLDEYHKYKGIEILFSAIQHLKQRFPEIILIVGGGGIKRDQYQKKAYEMGIGANISFVGYISESDLKHYYCGSTVFVLPSTDPTREGFGLVLLEAMACGRPVITTDIAGMADDIREFGSGIIIPREQHPKALIRAIAWFMEHPEEAETMGEAARKLVEQRYDWKVITKRIETIYEQSIR
jgi:glycosyltransferase involved in cell wall biosynthesis